MNEQTATNPQTGERVVLRGGQWVPLTDAPANPGPVLGPPKLRDPYKDAAERRAEEDQLIQRDNINYQRAKDSRSEDLAQRRFELSEKNANARASRQDKPTEYQSKSAGFLGRMLRAEDAYGGLDDGSKDARSAPGQWFHETFPGVENYFNSSQRQMADQNARDFITASLRQESGAAIAQDEYQNQYRIFYPMPGDSAEVIAQKALARKQAIEGFRIAAGPEASKVAQFSAKANKYDLPRTGNVDDYETGDEALGRSITETDVRGKRLTPEQEAGEEALFRAYGKRMTPEILQRYNAEIGWKQTPENAKAVVDYWLKTGKLASISYALEDRRARERAEAELKRRLEAEGMSKEDIGVSSQIDQGITYNLSDEIYGLSAGIKSAIDGNGFQRGYEGERDVQRLILEQARKNNGIAPEIGAGFFAPGGVGQNVAKGARRLARAGMMQGGLAGFGAGEGDASSQLGTAAIGAALGAGGGYVAEKSQPLLQRGLESIMTRRGRAGGVGADTMAAADRLGVRVMPADVGGPFTRRLTSANAQSVISAGSIARAGQQTVNDMAKARAAIAQGEGVVQPLDEAGDAVRQSAKRFAVTTSERGGRLYDRAEKMANGLKVKPLEAVQVLDRYIAEASEAGEVSGPLVANLQILRNSLAQEGGISTSAIRSIRTGIAQSLQKDGLRGSPQDRISKEIMAAASRDMERALAHGGRPNAAAAFRRADAYWRDRVEHIDEVLEKVAPQGRSGEDIAAHMESMMSGGRGGVRSFRGILRSMSNEEVDNFRATMIDRLGRAKKDNGEIDNFSGQRFITQWDTLSPKAKNALFGSGETRRALDDLATVARGTAGAQRYANHSNTGGALMNAGLGGVGGATAATSGGTFPIVMIAANYATGRLLSSPAVARYIARAPKEAEPAKVERYVRGLQRIAQRQPALAPDLNALQQKMLDHFSLGVQTRTVAQGQEGEGNIN